MQHLKAFGIMQTIGKILLLTIVAAAGLIVFKLMKQQKPITEEEIQKKVDELKNEYMKMRRSGRMTGDLARELHNLRLEAAELESLINPNIQVKDGKIIRYVSTRPPSGRR